MAFEEDLFRSINSGLANPVLDVLALLFDFSALAYVMLLYAAPLWARGRRTLAFDFLIALVAVVAVTQAIKYAIDRPRPADVYAGVRVLSLPFLPELSDPSFPSAHASRAFAFAILLGLHHRRSLPWLVPYAILVGVARIYEGVHYPSDIVGGAIVGIAVGALFWKLDTWPPYARVRVRVLGRWLSQGRGGSSELTPSSLPGRR